MALQEGTLTCREAVPLHVGLAWVLKTAKSGSAHWALGSAARSEHVSAGRSICRARLGGEGEGVAP